MILALPLLLSTFAAAQISDDNAPPTVAGPKPSLVSVEADCAADAYAACAGSCVAAAPALGAKAAPERVDGADEVALGSATVSARVQAVTGGYALVLGELAAGGKYFRPRPLFCPTSAAKNARLSFSLPSGKAVLYGGPGAWSVAPGAAAAPPKPAAGAYTAVDCRPFESADEASLREALFAALAGFGPGYPVAARPRPKRLEPPCAALARCAATMADAGAPKSFLAELAARQKGLSCKTTSSYTGPAALEKK